MRYLAIAGGMTNVYKSTTVHLPKHILQRATFCSATVISCQQSGVSDQHKARQSVLTSIRLPVYLHVGTSVDVPVSSPEPADVPMWPLANTLLTLLLKAIWNHLELSGHHPVPSRQCSEAARSCNTCKSLVQMLLFC